MVWSAWGSMWCEAKIFLDAWCKLGRKRLLAATRHIYDVLRESQRLRECWLCEATAQKERYEGSEYLDDDPCVVCLRPRVVEPSASRPSFIVAAAASSNRSARGSRTLQFPATRKDNVVFAMPHIVLQPGHD
jgi:hypothetical protein